MPGFLLSLREPKTAKEFCSRDCRTGGPIHLVLLVLLLQMLEGI